MTKNNQSSKPNKKKCRGNRKLRRLRSLFRARILAGKTVMILVDESYILKIIPTAHNEESKSLDQISIMQASRKQPKCPTDKLVFKEKNHVVKSNIKPNYLTMTDLVFLKRMIPVALDTGTSFIEWLDTTEKLHYVRQYAQLMNDIYCLRYQQDVWQTCNNVLMIAGIRSTTITKEMASGNNLSRWLFTICENVEKSQTIIVDQLNKAQQDLKEYQEHQHTVDLSIDAKLLLKLITTLVANELQQLRTKYEWAKLLFQYDANDYLQFKLFYDLNPTEDQIHSAKSIWQTTAHQLKVEEKLILLKHYAHSKRLLHTVNQLNHSNYNISKQLKRHTRDRHEQTAVQMKYEMLALSIAKAEEIIQSDKKRINDEKKKLLNGQILFTSSILARIMNAIQARQNNMHERTQHQVTHNMVSLF